MKMAKRISAAVAALLVYLQPIEAQRVNLTAPGGGFITITPGTPIRLWPGQGPYLMNRWMIQVRPNAGTSGVVYLMLGVPVGKACSATNAAHLSATLSASTSASPGGSLSDPQGANGNTPADAEDMAQACVDGTQADTITVTGWHQT